MKKEIKISIVVAMYNTEKYIFKCINSLINQTYKNIEIIIIDDGSTDNSYQICLNFANNDKRIKIYKKSNGGVSSARNFGINVATGDFITFVDSDDYIYINAIEKALNDIEIDDNLCIYDCTNQKENIIKRELMNIEQKEEYIKSVLLWNNEYNNCIYINNAFSHLYNLNKIKDNNIYFDENLIVGEDMIFNIEVAKYINNVKYSRVKFYNYRTNINSIMHKSNKDILDNDEEFHVCLFNLLKESNFNKLYKIARIRSPLGGIITCCKHYIFIDKELKYSNRIKILNSILDKEIYSYAIERIKEVRQYLNIKQYVYLILIKNKLYRLVYFLMRY